MTIPELLRAAVVCVCAGVVAVAVASPAVAGEPGTSAPRPTLDLGLAIAIPRDDAGARVVDEAWVAQRIAEANRLWSAAGVRFRWTLEEDLPTAQREAHSREDRDAVGALVVRGHVRVAIVTALEDVDEPGRLRMGVCWTHRRDGSRYILLSTASFPAVLAHELGHYLGNPHVFQADNLMSYTRTPGGELFVDAAQTTRARTTALRLLERGTVVDVGPARRIP